ncbi:unnamed protein product [Acanthoscelides obtectus]|uniref:Uncharacterized protein n=1 Tax=Acanthoscelides obtectus TaxID=200917 RepID=A0A9P0KSS8_ACAOB|nr:unnamed protein product [Acanthoscelides obtectus]CAK1655808.1 hypothetical protein AOBTE_LOCUS19353 [Acanthoscelides obtectus]
MQRIWALSTIETSKGQHLAWESQFIEDASLQLNVRSSGRSKNDDYSYFHSFPELKTDLRCLRCVRENQYQLLASITGSRAQGNMDSNIENRKDLTERYF